LPSYEEFLEHKSQYGELSGFDPVWIPDYLFDFQRYLTDWSIRKGRGGLLEDCGLGKTVQELVWAENIVRYTNKRVLIATPLAVGPQTVREGEKFGIACRICRDGKLLAKDKIVVTNYESLHKFNRNDYVGMVCDESSALKAFNGVRRAAVTEFIHKMPYRLLGTATPAPNDYTEIGTASELLGELGLQDMLQRFFINQNRNSTDVSRHWRGHAAPREFEQKQWRFKGHAPQPFFRWVCSYSRACRKPSDLGYPDDKFILPPLIEKEHIVKSRTLLKGYLVAMPARGMRQEREERRRTIVERCELAAELANKDQKPSIVWCHLNAEGDLLEKLVKGVVQVSGSDSDEAKIEAYDAFTRGQVRKLVIKPKIGAWGMNWQHCAHVITFASHSYESYYQAVRRCWRFGQKNPVTVDIIASEGEVGAKDNLRRKSIAADKLFTELVKHMSEELVIKRSINGTQKVSIPSWL
jgi:hypothetical protein